MFKNSIKTVAASIALLACMANPAGAASLSFSPSSSSVSAGSGFDVDLMISGLSALQDLGAFDLTVNFDAGVLSFGSYTLGGGLGNLASFDAIDASLGSTASGAINLAEISLLWDLSPQADAFTLATLHFTAASSGTSALSYSAVTLGDALGDAITPSLSSASFAVTAVPEPESYALLLAGLGLLSLARRKHALK